MKRLFLLASLIACEYASKAVLQHSEEKIINFAEIGVVIAATTSFPALNKTGFIYVSQNFGASWVNAGVNTTWNDISISATGETQTALVSNGPIFISRDYGKSWRPSTSAPSAKWQSISVSGSGQSQTAVTSDGRVFVSSTYGAIWALSLSNPALSWGFVCVSALGRFQTVVSGTSISMALSSDYGATWTITTPSPDIDFFESISMSADGKYQSTSGIGGTSRSGMVLVSSNYGASWTSTMPAPPGYMGYSRIVGVSASGQNQTVAGCWDGIFTSSDYGNTWHQVVAPATACWLSISLSVTGQYQAIATGRDGNPNLPIAISSDYGVTWANSSSPKRAWSGLSIAAASGPGELPIQ